MARYERSGVSLVAVAGFGWLLLLAGVIIFLLVGQFHRRLDRQHDRAERRAAERAGPLRLLRDRFPPEPRLQGLPGHGVQPLQEIQDLREQEDAVLGSYGWVDRQAGTVRIPIGEAMRLVAERGGAAVTAPAAPAPEAAPAPGPGDDGRRADEVIVR